VTVIEFFTEELNFELKNEEKYVSLLQRTIEYEKFRIDHLNIINTSVRRIIEINKKFLNHDYETDIITFPYNHPQEPLVLEGDLFVSIPTVDFNARNYSISFEHELARVYLHGLLHLIGYNDKTEEEVKKVRFKENFFLGKYFL